MIYERQIINAILEKEVQPNANLHLQLAKLGFVNANGKPFNSGQINSLLHSARQEERKRKHRYVESCGIDRKKNPCGDASDY
ncbi:MAG: hypothetical protein Crog4KO_12220 [Crocinitomicaceae bacterium]